MTIELLLLEMLKRISIAIILGLILTQTRFIDHIIKYRLTKYDQIICIALFSTMSIIASYAGVPVNDALANSRMVGIMAAGLIAGPRVGVSVGIIAGVHRYFLGGFSAFACAVSSIVEGIISSIIYRCYPDRSIPPYITFAIGALTEMVQMAIILGLATPYEEAVNLVNNIAVPMTIANAIGLTLFMLIIENAKAFRENIVAKQSHTILSIVKKTAPLLRRGLDPQGADQVVKIIKRMTGYDAVSITNDKEVLAYVGAERDHHGPQCKHNLTRLTYRALENNTVQIAETHRDIGCHHPGCTLSSAIIAPLRMHHKVIGTLKLYYAHKNRHMTPIDKSFAEGLAGLFSTQLELAEVDKQAQEVERAKMQALYAQINPHFLFNTLNTIASLIRTNPELARQVLVKFSNLFRFTLQYTGKIISFSQEWEHTRGFLYIAQTRQGDKMKVVTKVPSDVMTCSVPSLILQPLIENAIKHGLLPLSQGGTITIKATRDNHFLYLSVSDNGVGFKEVPSKYLRSIHSKDGQHVGLKNVHDRLIGLYGPDYGLHIETAPHKGTTISLTIPQELTHD